MKNQRILAGVLAAAVVSAAGCKNPLGPGCTSQSGPVAAVSGTIGAGQTLVHRLPYGTEGSQNDIRVSWTNQGQPGGPRLQFYATRTACDDFAPARASGACEILGMAGRVEEVVVSTMHVTHGRGNPEHLGTPPEYKVWVVGDPQQSADYHVTSAWRHGVEC